MRQYRWFHNRIGKKIYRKPIDLCSCEDCKDAAEVRIRDKEHAYLIYIHSFELRIDFYDKKDFEKLNFKMSTKGTGLKKCPCGNTFYSRYYHAKFCQNKCRMEAKLIKT